MNSGQAETDDVLRKCGRIWWLLPEAVLGGHHCCWILMGVPSSRKQEYENNKLWILIKNTSQQEWSMFYVFLFFLSF